MIKSPGHTAEPQSLNLNLSGAVIWAPVFPDCFPKWLRFTLLMEPIPVSPRSSPPQNSSDALAPQLERPSPMGRALSLLPGLPGALISPCDPPCCHPFPGNSTFSQRHSDPVILQTSSHPFSSENSVSLCFSIQLPLLLYHFSSSFFFLLLVVHWSSDGRCTECKWNGKF